MRRRILVTLTLGLMALLAGFLCGAFANNNAFGHNTSETQKWINNHKKPITTKLEVRSLVGTAGGEVYSYTLTDCGGSTYHTGPQLMWLQDTIK